jgi:hypothetical protein
MFLPDADTQMANRHVKNSPADELPRFRWDVPYLAAGGSALRYSSSTPKPRMIKVPGGYKMVRPA